MHHFGLQRISDSYNHLPDSRWSRGKGQSRSPINLILVPGHISLLFERGQTAEGAELRRGPLYFWKSRVTLPAILLQSLQSPVHLESHSDSSTAYGTLFCNTSMTKLFLAQRGLHFQTFRGRGSRMGYPAYRADARKAPHCELSNPTELHPCG